MIRRAATTSSAHRRPLFGSARSVALLTGIAAALLALAPDARTQAPPGYYTSVDASNPGALRATLHAVIDDHQRFPYTSGSTDTWDILESAMQDPANSGRILEVYRNESHPKQGGGNSFYNREHSWPKSYGFPDDGSSNYPYTDCHLLFLCDPSYNSSRSNKPFRNCSSGCQEKPTLFNNGQGGGSGQYPGNSNWTSGSFTQGTWETWNGRRGDIARAQLYADVRYEGGMHGGTGASEPDLILTDIESLIDNSNTGNNESVAYMGMLSVLLQWHLEDPVDAVERQKNDVVFAFQGNRNPFVDHPEWVECLFSGVCGPPIATYCTAKVNSCGGTPQIAFSGQPSAGTSNGFQIFASGARGPKANGSKSLGILLYTETGPRVPAAPFAGGLLCIAAPLSRTVQFEAVGGTTLACDATFTADMNAFAAGALGGNPKPYLSTPGTRVDVQWWGRDTFAHGSFLSDALHYTVAP